MASHGMAVVGPMIEVDPLL